MKKTKTQKGITLVALIITIVVLLILAAVAISSIQDNGILSYAKNSAHAWNNALANEQALVGEYLNYLNTHMPTQTPQSPATPTLPTVPTMTVPTGIDGISISGNSLTVKAKGGSGTGYQYSTNGSTWSTTTSSNYTFDNLFANGTNWTIYARSADSEKASNPIQLKLISFNFEFYPYLQQKLYVPYGTTWETFIEDNFANQSIDYTYNGGHSYWFGIGCIYGDYELCLAYPAPDNIVGHAHGHIQYENPTSGYEEIVLAQETIIENGNYNGHAS